LIRLPRFSLKDECIVKMTEHRCIFYGVFVMHRVGVGNEHQPVVGLKRLINDTVFFILREMLFQMF